MILTLAACAPKVPDDVSLEESGVGFNDYVTYEEQRIRREGELRGVTPAFEEGSSVGPAGARRQVSVNNPGISDEQDFNAVSGRESIQSDAQRIEANAGAYQVIQPTAVPERKRSDGVNIVEFALSTSNPMGQQVHRRSSVNADKRFEKACAKYSSADQAQQDFLSSGGPERDRKGVDPDGDGYACFWDPRPFRTARGG
jgi:hypothetical protein